MNKDQKLFRDKFIEFAEELYKQGDKELLNILRQQKIDRDKILNEVGMMLSTACILSHRYGRWVWATAFLTRLDLPKRRGDIRTRWFSLLRNCTM